MNKIVWPNFWLTEMNPQPFGTEATLLTLMPPQPLATNEISNVRIQKKREFSRSLKFSASFFEATRTDIVFFFFFPKNAAKILGWKMAKFCQARQRHHRCNSFFFASVPIKMVEKEGKTLRWECSEKGKIPNKTKPDVKEITSWLLACPLTVEGDPGIIPVASKGVNCVNMQFFPEWKNYPAIADSSD